jgi:magnesium-transporting ATPase (P-type)
MLTFILFKGDTQSLDYTHEAAASHTTVFDARNIAFKGSYCTEGDGLAVVIRTGHYTVIYTNLKSTAKFLSGKRPIFLACLKWICATLPM